MPDAPTPQPTRLRVHPPGARPPSIVPFGLGGWSDEPDAATLIAVPRSEDATTLASALPEPAALPAGAGGLVVIPGDAYARRGFLARLLTSGNADGMTRHARATALLARGYTRIGAGVDPASGFDLVWGYAADDDASA